MVSSMALEDNPYIIGRPVYEPELFFGREKLFDFIKDNLNKRAQVILLHGQRRIGKSSVLSQIPHFVRLEQFIFVAISLEGQSQKALSEVLYDLARDIVDHLDLSQQHLTLPTKTELEKDAGVFFNNFLPQVYRAIDGKNLVLLLDEFDVLGDSNEDSAVAHLFPYLQSFVYRQKELFIIPVVGRRLDDMPNLFALFKQAPNLEIGLLDRRSVERLITKPAEGVLKYNDDAIDAIWNLAAGHPYFTQVVCFALFSQARDQQNWQVTRANVENIVNEAIEIGEAGLTWFRDGLPIPERVVFSAVAEAQQQKISNSAKNGDSQLEVDNGEPLRLLQGYGVVLTEALSRAEERLLEWNFLQHPVVTQSLLPLVTIFSETYKVTVELVRRWLVKRYPLRREIWELEKLDEQGDQIYEKAVEALRDGNVRQALQLYEQVLTANPNNFHALFEMAESYLDVGDFRQAVEVFTRAYQVEPIRSKEGFVQARLGYGKLLMQQGEARRAKEQFEGALKLDPSNEEINSLSRRLLSRNIALLIGVSEYEPGLVPLLVAEKNVEAMQRVLQHPEIGSFDEVKMLVNPQQQEMAVAIETLFNDRNKNDLVLLFFSGHVIKDESGRLYFATRNTRKTDTGVLLKSTTVPANFLHEIMSNSRSKRQVIILDCCFSAVFSENMSERDNVIDIKNQLGGEDRAVLTSSTSTQLAFEQQGVDTSTYTSYIVEGLETGAADRDEDGWISVDELHEYAAKKVQKSTPAMKPEIYPVKGGFKIKLAKAPSNDPRLTYLREVEYWVEGGNGEISVAGRAALDALQETLKLSPDDAAAIKTQVLAPIENKKKKLQRYELAFRDEIRQGFPLSDRTGTNLKRLQQVLGLRDEDIDLIEAPIIVEQPLTAPPVVFNSPRLPNSNFKYYIGACIIGLIGVTIGGTLVYFLLPRYLSQPIKNPTCTKETYILNDRISLGEEILLRQDTNTNPDKEAGVQAFLKGDCQLAIDKLNSYRKANITDPEALIYLNNAKGRQKGDRLKIAVSVPIGTSPNVAKEILRGVAQAQDEVNSNGGINGKALEVAIANDENNPSKAVQIATQFVKDSSILAVVGHNANNASISAAPVYQQQGLVMISPTSSAQNLSGIGNYIFRTAPSISSVTEILSHYISISGRTNTAICIDSRAIDNLSFLNELGRTILNKRGKVNSTDCDFSAPNFNPNTIIYQAISTGADSLILAPAIDSIHKSLEIAAANKGRLALFGSSTLYSYQTLKNGQAFNGMVLAVPWFPQAFPNNPFSKNAQQLWGGSVSWRTATSYDATRAIIKGLMKSDTRTGLQRVLRSPNFSTDGATGKIQFLPSGDGTNNAIFLVKVQQKPATDNYEFVLITP